MAAGWKRLGHLTILLTAASGGLTACSSPTGGAAGSGDAEFDRGVCAMARDGATKEDFADMIMNSTKDNDEAMEMARKIGRAKSTC